MEKKAKPGTTILKIRAVKPGDKAGTITIKNKPTPAPDFRPRTDRKTQRYV